MARVQTQTMRTATAIGDIDGQWMTKEVAMPLNGSPRRNDVKQGGLQTAILYILWETMMTIQRGLLI